MKCVLKCVLGGDSEPFYSTHFQKPNESQHCHHFVTVSEHVNVLRKSDSIRRKKKKKMKDRKKKQLLFEFQEGSHTILVFGLDNNNNNNDNNNNKTHVFGFLKFFSTSEVT